MPSDSRWTSVLIDDEADVREVTALMLRDAGFEVHQAGDGEAGLRLIRETAPQIVVTDIRMPKLDGLGVLRRVKADHPDTEVIVITAFGDMDLAIEALRLDASDFVTKPMSAEAFALALRRARERYSARRGLQDYASLLETENVRTAQELLKAIRYQRNLIEGSMDGILGLDGKRPGRGVQSGPGRTDRPAGK